MKSSHGYVQAEKLCKSNASDSHTARGHLIKGSVQQFHLYAPLFTPLSLMHLKHLASSRCNAHETAKAFSGDEVGLHGTTWYHAKVHPALDKMWGEESTTITEVHQRWPEGNPLYQSTYRIKCNELLRYKVCFSLGDFKSELFQLVCIPNSSSLPQALFPYILLYAVMLWVQSSWFGNCTIRCSRYGTWAHFRPSWPLSYLLSKALVSVMVWMISAALKCWPRGVSLPRRSQTHLTCSVNRDAN